MYGYGPYYHFFVISLSFLCYCNYYTPSRLCVIQNQFFIKQLVKSFNSSVGRAQGWKLWGRWFESILKHITRNYKIYFKYLYFNLPHLYIQQSNKGSHNISVLLLKDFFYFTSLHLRFSSLFYSTQLVDLFSYELPSHLRTPQTSQQNLPYSSYTEAYLVYNFHNILFQDRFFFFCVSTLKNRKSSEISSIAELFPNASWLEREVAELSGVTFNNKKDLRNLMLQYGDTSVPFQKSAPSIGYKEFYYDSVNDILIETPITLQV